MKKSCDLKSPLMQKSLSGSVYLLLLLCLTVSHTVTAQKSNLQLIEETDYTINTKKDKSSFSKILPKNTYYTTSFREFSTSSFQYFSFPKNFFMVVDRTLRTGRLNFMYTQPSRRNEYGLIKDQPYYYKFKNDK